MFSMGWAREAHGYKGKWITNLQLCLRWKISGFWLSNQNIVTGFISYVVPERQKSKCVNSFTEGWLLTLREFVRACVHSVGFQRDCFHIEAALTSTSKCLLWPIHVQVPQNKLWHRLYSLTASYCLADWGLSWWKRRQEVRKKKKKAGRAQGRKMQRQKWSIKCILAKLKFSFNPYYSLCQVISYSLIQLSCVWILLAGWITTIT